MRGSGIGNFPLGERTHPLLFPSTLVLWLDLADEKSTRSGGGKRPQILPPSSFGSRRQAAPYIKLMVTMARGVNTLPGWRNLGQARSGPELGQPPFPW